MGGMSDLIGYHGAANAGMLGPAFHAGLEEGAVDDQLTAAVEQVEQARLAPGPVELVLLLNGQPRHPPTPRRPARHERGSAPSPSRAVAGAQSPTPVLTR